MDEEPPADTTEPWDLDPAIGRWVESALGGTVDGCVRTTSGGSRLTYLAELIDGDGARHPIVVRVEGQGSFTGTELSLEREAAAYRALGSTPVPVPQVLAVADDGGAIVLERVAGSDDLSSLPADQIDSVLDHFASVLAEMHTLDPGSLDLPGFGMPATPEDHARLDVDMWARLAAGVTDLDPLIAFAEGWLLAHPPARVQRTCFVQGDTGPGNFLAAGGRVTGLVDMEFAHLGDPMDDLAWVQMRAQAIPGATERIFDRYQRQSGIEVDDDSLAYYGLAVLYRCAVTTSLAVTRGGGVRGLAAYLLVTQRYLDQIAGRFADLEEVAVEPAGDQPDTLTPRTAMYDQIIEAIRAATRGIDDPGLRETTRDSQILVHYLRAYDRIGVDMAEADLSDQEQTFGSRMIPDDLIGRARDAGRSGDPDVLAYLLRRRRREAALWRTLLERRR